MHLLYWYEEAAGKTGDTGNDGGETEGPQGEGADESYQQCSPALVEGKVHNHHLTEHLEVIGIGIHQLQMVKLKTSRLPMEIPWVLWGEIWFVQNCSQEKSSPEKGS